MTTLRDYVLDHRCPNCGVTMERRPPRRRSWWRTAMIVAVVLNLLIGAVAAVGGEWAHGAYCVALATFLVVVDR